MTKKSTYEELEKKIQELEQSKFLLNRPEEKVKESQAKYKQLFNKMKDGVAVYEAVDGGKDFIFRDINAAGERLANVKKSEIIGRSLYEIRPNIDEFGLVDVLRNVWQTGKAENHSERFYEDEKLQGWFDNYVYKLESGEVVAMFTDNTAGKLVEGLLQRSEALLKTTEQLTKVGGWEWDVEKQTMFWTDEVYRIHDFQQSEFPPGSTEHIEQSIECYDPEDRPVILEAFRNCAEKGQSYDLELPFNTVKGQRIWIRTIAKELI